MSLKEALSYILAFFVLTLGISFEGLLVLSNNEPFGLVLLVLVYVVIVLAFELALLLFIYKVRQSLFFLFEGILLSVNLFLLKLIFFESFQSIGYVSVILGVFIFGYFFGVLLSRISKISSKKRKCIFTVTLFMFIAGPLVHVASNKIESALPLNKEELDAWVNLKFKDKPNIHIVSFDSLIPPQTALEYLDISELPYNDIVKQHMLKIELSFSPKVPSQESLNSVMNLDQKKIPHRNGYFTGKYRSVLSTIANNNDYELTNGYSSEYFGQKGGHLTAYNLGDQTLKDSSLCVAAGDGLVSLRIYGVCKIFGEFFGLAHFAGYGTFTKDWAEKVLGIISSLSEKEGPQITFHYIYNPIGHSPLSYSHGNQQQRADYLKQFSVRSKRAADVMKELVDIIKKQDPKALVLIFGDHGAWLSRGVKYKEDSQFFMKDRHMIELAVLKTEHKCAESDQVFRYASAYATPSRVLAGMLRCLAEDPLVMDKLVDFGDRIDECDDSDAHQLKLVSEDIEQSSKCFYAP